MLAASSPTSDVPIVAPSPPQAASLPMSIIIVGVGPAEFDGKCVCMLAFVHVSAYL